MPALLKTKTGQFVKFEQDEKGYLIVAMGKDRVGELNRVGYFPTKEKANEFYEDYLKPEK